MTRARENADGARLDAPLASPTFTGTTTVSGDLVPATPLSHRNVFINGAMQISQRYGTDVHTPTHPDFGLDRYKVHYSGGPVFSSQQVTDVPAGKGFTHSTKYTVTTADATATAGDQAYVKVLLEGHDWARFCYGTASAKTTTLSFYVKSSVAGVYSMAYKNGSVNRSYSQVYTIASADTWERISITIPGDTSGTWATDDTIGCSVSFDLGSGSGRYQTAGSWGTGNIDGATSAGADTWINTSGATFYITGIQLEEGSSATPFEFRSYADELLRCQRYYEKADFSGASDGYGVANTQIYQLSGSTREGFSAYYFRTTMNHDPDFTYSHPTHFRFLANGAGLAVSNVTANSCTYSSRIKWHTTAGGTAGHGALVDSTDSSAWLAFEAEL